MEATALINQIVAGVVGLVGIYGALDKLHEEKAKRAKGARNAEKDEDAKSGAETEKIREIVRGRADGDMDQADGDMDQLEELLERIEARQQHDHKFMASQFADTRALAEEVEALFESSPHAIVIADGENIITRWNEAATLLLGYGRGEAVGQPVLLIIPTALQGAHLAGLEHWRRTGEARVIGRGPIALTARRKSGEEIPIWLTLYANRRHDQRSSYDSDDEKAFVCGWLTPRIII